ncbi:MAG: ATP-binding protein [Opitutus sp.]|nr:ATP-binding protein [Opitutus sp.]MCS6277601.1 ATP-binding protein [Opitutus sp.]MCS6300719.1 ATP-binding protein [Opitutus sp.]
MKTEPEKPDLLKDQLKYLKLGYLLRHHGELTAEAAKARCSHAEFLRRLVQAETQDRQIRALERRIQAARFPVKKTVDQFQWDWPKELNEAQVRHLFELGFVKERTNAVFCGGVGLGKTHLASALGYAACQAGYTVLFTTAVDAINALVTAQSLHRLQAELKRYMTPAVLVLDEVGYLPLDKAGADLLFQIVSQRYERGSLIVTTNKAYKHWAGIFNNDAGITAAILDRLLHRAQTVVIEGKSYRMKDRLTDEPAS